MLDYAEDDFEDVFMQTFRIGFKDIFGNDVQHDLKECAADISVTQSNKQVGEVYSSLFFFFLSAVLPPPPPPPSLSLSLSLLLLSL